MAKDARDPVRRAILIAIGGEPSIVSLVPADRHYPPARPAKPQWPFIGYGVMTSVASRANCIDGSIISGAIHAFAKGGDEAAGAIVAALAAFLDGPDGNGRVMDLAPFPGRATIHVPSTRVIQDAGDAASWHGIVNLYITVAA